ncbi:MAG TPA: DNA primase, partial [Clostridiales bacterium]|nr:DNA primase [Clostridiales bacterium]
MIDDKFIDELKEKNNLVDVASKYCDLKRKGAVNYWACCPLPGHSEKTPSFTVNEPGQFFKCFGCGRGGDVISFIRIMENLDYVGAVRFLAERAGLPMPDDNRDYAKIAKERSERDRLLALMKTTAMFYVENLKDPRAKKYIDYMQSREVDMRTMKIFGIGASLDMSSLPRHLKAKGFTEEEMIKCCVCKKKVKDDGSSFIYDFLAERLIFPIINNLGNVIAFGGRTLEKNPRFMKYKNTEETELFKKNRTLFNINKLKLERAKQELSEVILVEGYMGTIRPYINGFKNVVASMGTSLTVEQAKILKRYAPTVIICYDGDSAGQKSTLRGLDILAGQGLEVKVLQLPPPDDPDDFIRKHGAEEFKKLLDESLPLIDYKLKILEKGYDITNDAERRKYIQEAIKV